MTPELLLGPTQCHALAASVLTDLNPASPSNRLVLTSISEAIERASVRLPASQSARQSAGVHM